MKTTLRKYFCVPLALKVFSCSNDGRGRFEKVIPFNTRQFFGRNIKCEFQNFTTGCCEGVYGNREFNVSIR